MTENKTNEQAKQHILNLIPENNSGYEIKLLTAAYNDLLNAEYQELNLSGFRGAEGRCMTPEEADTAFMPQRN